MSHVILRSKLNMADTWVEEVEARLIILWQIFPLLYDVADKNYLSNVLKERAYREIAEELNRTCFCEETLRSWKVPLTE